MTELRRLAHPEWLLIALIANPILLGFASAWSLPTGPIGAVIYGVPIIVLLDDVLRRGRLTIPQGAGVAMTFVVFAAISILWSSDSEYGLQKLVNLLVLGVIPALAMVASVRRLRRPLDWNTIARRAAILGAIAFAGLVLIPSNRVVGRVSIGETNPIWLGRAVAMCVALALGCSKHPAGRRIAFALPSIAALVITQTRGPFLALGLALLFGAGSIALTKGGGRWVARLGVVVVYGLVTVLIILSGFGLGRFEGTLGSADASGSSRIEAFEDSVEQAGVSPIVGNGLGSWESDELALQYPHNAVAEVISETGLVGLALWSAAIVSFVLATRRTALLIAFLTALLMAMTSGDLGGNPWYWAIGILALGLRDVAPTEDDPTAAPEAPAAVEASAPPP